MIALVVLIYLALFVLWIYAFVLFVKLAKRGIKALDIHLNRNINKESSDIFINQNANRE